MQRAWRIGLGAGRLLVAVGALVMVSGAMAQLAAAKVASASEEIMLVGRWQKSTDAACAVAYPKNLEFRAGGTYLSASAPESFAIWQSGSYELVGSDRIRIQIANDAMIEYQFHLASGGRLTFVDDQGCEITYRRVE
jgi:hypothetical protein